MWLIGAASRSSAGFDGGNPYGANYSTGGGFMAGGEDSPSTKVSWADWWSAAMCALGLGAAASQKAASGEVWWAEAAAPPCLTSACSAGRHRQRPRVDTGR